MADRFPSLEDIDAGQTEIKSGDVGEGDFLSREKAVLGEDAAIFQANDNKNATIEEGDDDDLLGGDDDFTANAGGQRQGEDDFDDFETSFPAVSTGNENVGPGGAVTGATGGGGGNYTNYAPQMHEEDTEPIRAWREKRDADVARRDEGSDRKKQETIATAQKDIDSFYESYNRKVDRQKAQTTKEADEYLAKREDTTAGGTSWERIAKLVDVSGKGQLSGGDGSTKKRMRELLLSLKGDKDAPGAGGV